MSIRRLFSCVGFSCYAWSLIFFICLNINCKFRRDYTLYSVWLIWMMFILFVECGEEWHWVATQAVPGALAERFFSSSIYQQSQIFLFPQSSFLCPFWIVSSAVIRIGITKLHIPKHFLISGKFQVFHDIFLFTMFWFLQFGERFLFLVYGSSAWSSGWGGAICFNHKKNVFMPTRVIEKRETCNPVDFAIPADH